MPRRYQKAVHNDGNHERGCLYEHFHVPTLHKRLHESGSNVEKSPEMVTIKALQASKLSLQCLCWRAAGIFAAQKCYV